MKRPYLNQIDREAYRIGTFIGDRAMLDYRLMVFCRELIKPIKPFLEWLIRLLAKCLNKLK